MLAVRGKQAIALASLGGYGIRRFSSDCRATGAVQGDQQCLGGQGLDVARVVSSETGNCTVMCYATKMEDEPCLYECSACQTNLLLISLQYMCTAHHSWPKWRRLSMFLRQHTMVPFKTFCVRSRRGTTISLHGVATWRGPGPKGTMTLNFASG
jgi:hypothetical protein